MTTSGDTIVVVAASARALSQCLRRAGLPRPGSALLAVDAFGDDDLRATVDAWQHLPLDRLHDTGEVVAAVAAVARHVAVPPRGGVRVLLGGGFDGVPSVLEVLNQRHRILNAPAAAWGAARDPFLFSRLGIATPETRVDPPATSAGWLCRRVASGAGLGIVPAAFGWPRAAATCMAGDHTSPHVFWQRQVAGTPVSILFCAHRDGIVVVGCNRQWCNPAPGAPFRFGGVASGFDPGRLPREQLIEAAVRVSAATGLRGLCSLDAIITRRCEVLALEVNPRPTASVELYDREAPGLLALHVAAVDAQPLPDWRPAALVNRGLAVVYAPVPWRLEVPPRQAADWRRGARIPAGAPAFTVHTRAASAERGMRALRARVNRLLCSAGNVRRGASHFLQCDTFESFSGRDHA